MNRMIVFAIMLVWSRLDMSSAAVSSCYLCTDCSTPCNGVSCTTKETCTVTTGTDVCYRRIDSKGKFQQGCATTATAFSYSSVTMCTVDDCNAVALACYSCTGCYTPSTKTMCSSPNNQLCYVGYKSDGSVDADCGASSIDLSSYTKSSKCTTDLCNSIPTTSKNNTNQLSAYLALLIISSVFSRLIENIY